jgi:hypothetical protein
MKTKIKRNYKKCVPINNYKKTNNHIFTSSRRIGKGDLIIYCCWCGQKKLH